MGHIHEWRDGLTDVRNFSHLTLGATAQKVVRMKYMQSLFELISSTSYDWPNKSKGKHIRLCVKRKKKSKKAFN